MKCVIIYFSQTGNTEKIAKAVCKGVEQAAGTCDFLKLKDANPRRLSGYDLIGFGMPIFHVEPLNVGAFIKDLWAVGGKHAFVFSTHGTIPEYFLPSVVPKLQNRGLTVIGWADWYADAFIPWHPEPYPTHGHPDEIDMEEAEAFGKKMVEFSRRITAGETHLIPPMPEVPPPLPPTNELGIQDTTDDPSVFKYHKELCKFPKCRLCMDNCPVYSIDLSMHPPVIASCCQPHCTFCTLICPTGAIEIDAFVEAQTPNYKRTTETIALPRLEEAEAKGTFRRHVPVEDIGFDTMFYEVHNGHPKFIVGKGLVKSKRRK